MFVDGGVLLADVIKLDDRTGCSHRRTAESGYVGSVSKSSTQRRHKDSYCFRLMFSGIAKTLSHAGLVSDGEDFVYNLIYYVA